MVNSWFQLLASFFLLLSPCFFLLAPCFLLLSSCSLLLSSCFLPPHHSKFVIRDFRIHNSPFIIHQRPSWRRPSSELDPALPFALRGTWRPRFRQSGSLRPLSRARPSPDRGAG